MRNPQSAIRNPQWPAVPLVAGLVAALVATGARTEPAPAAVARLSPLPQKMEIQPGETYRFSARTTVLEPRELADRFAFAHLRRFLGAATDVTPREAILAGPPAALQKPLEALGVAASEVADLGPEGYALACGKASEDGGTERPTLVCAAHTARGFAYAIATLERLGRFAPLDADGTGPAPQAGAARPSGRAVELPRLKIVDRPGLPVRGILEAFQGRPWSHAARLSMIAFAGRHKMNLYALAPADDPLHRERWRDTLPPEAAAQLRELATACAREQVDFAYGLRPGESIRYTDEDDVKRLLARIDAARDLGARHVALLFDNLPKELAHPPDREKFADPAAAQCALANRVWAHVKGADPQARLFFCPTDPWGLDETPSSRRVREQLDPAIAVFWNGPNVVARTIEEADVGRAAERFGRMPFLWDNYPVNYYAKHRLFVGPLRGRAPRAAARLAGLVANPMERAEASKIALATVADFAWNPAAYDPEIAWAAALSEAAGGRPAALAALRTFAENSQSSWIHGVESPVLAPLLRAYEEKGEEEPLARHLAEMAKAREDLAAALPDSALAADLAPWTARLETDCRRALDAIGMARALRTERLGEAWERRFALAVGAPPAEDAVEVAGGALAAFERRLIDAADRWFGLGRAVSVSSSLPAMESFAPALAADGSLATSFRTGQPPNAGDHVALDLGLSRLVGRVEILQGDAEHKEDYLHDGLLEISTDGNEWKEIGKLRGVEEKIDLAQPVTARWLRARALQPQERWLLVREFAVYTLDDPTVQTTMPVPETGAALSAVVDRRPDTAFATAGPAPAGAHVTIDLRVPRDVTRVSILQDPSAFLKRGRLALSADGAAWDDAGEVRAPATRLEWAEPRRARYVRLETVEPIPGPVRIHEIGVGWK